MILQDYEAHLMQYNDYVIHKRLLMYAPPVLLVIGTFGNLFSFIILIKSARKLSSYSYLSVLAVMDLLVLYIGLLRIWIGQFTVEIETRSNELCKLMMFLGYVASDSSVWLIIAVTVERAIVVLFPLRAARICTARYARFCSIGIVLSFLVINSHFLWTVELQTLTYNKTNGSINEEILSICGAKERYISLVENVWPWIDAMIYSFYPFVVIMLLNSLIVRHVITAKRMRSGLQLSSTLDKGRRPITGHRTRNNEHGRKITITLLTISFSFLLTALPMNIVVLICNSSNPDNFKSYSKVNLIRTIAQLLMYTNHSINFFLYCATGRKFRKQFINILCFCTKDAGHKFTREPVSKCLLDHSQSNSRTGKTVHFELEGLNSIRSNV